MKSVVFSALAEIELQDATDWYELKEKGLGLRFKTHIKHEIGKIATNPFNSPLISETDVRCKVVKLFPYYIYYELDQKNDSIVVLAIAHQRRNPDYSF